jgi:PPK2 family polyphosphate:nucleotide phosphotransferase
MRETIALGEVIKKFRVPADKKVRLKRFATAWAGNLHVPKVKRKRFAKTLLRQDIVRLAQAQELLYAADTWSVLIILQAMDAAGKDSTIKHVMSGVNPLGCQVYSFKHPSDEELDHDFLWRCVKALPERGRIGIFNRSYYEEVLVPKVQPDVLAAQHLPDGKATKEFWAARYDDINCFERHLVRSGTKVLKFFLHLSPEEQRQRFLKRLEDPRKHWKFSSADIAQRERWNDYQKAYENLLSATSTKWAPWHVIPADHKWVSRAVVAAILIDAIQSLDLHYPEPTAEQKRQIAAAKKKLAKR